MGLCCRTHLVSLKNDSGGFGHLHTDDGTDITHGEKVNGSVVSNMLSKFENDFGGFDHLHADDGTSVDASVDELDVAFINTLTKTNWMRETPHEDEEALPVEYGAVYHSNEQGGMAQANQTAIDKVAAARVREQANQAAIDRSAARVRKREPVTSGPGGEEPRRTKRSKKAPYSHDTKAGTRKPISSMDFE